MSTKKEKRTYDLEKEGGRGVGRMRSNNLVVYSLCTTVLKRFVWRNFGASKIGFFDCRT